MQSRPDVAHMTARHSAARLGGTLVVALLALALPFIVAQTAAADVRPPGGRLNDPTVRKVDIAEPAIVRIALLFNVKITLTLCGQDYTLPQSYQTGGLGSGAFISANGDVLTADHMVAANGADGRLEMASRIVV
jgi:S1-C subfamily serine protease